MFFFDNAEIKSAVEAEGISPAQLLLSWAVQRGTVPIPKTVIESRLKENLNVRPVSVFGRTIPRAKLGIAGGEALRQGYERSGQLS
jgi:aryl-alcohol dehydrogenase-like predicted oxidoreductase